MDESMAAGEMEKLRIGEKTKLEVSKDDFMVFRKLLLKQPDFKHFRGAAQRGGDVIYTYLENERS